MIQRPTTPHAGELIGDHWPEVDEVALANVAVDLTTKAAAASTAESKTYTDGATYHSQLPEGFENQVQAIHKVGDMAMSLSGWIGKGAGEAGAAAGSVVITKTMITTAVTAAEALIAAKEAEIAMLSTALIDPIFARLRIQQLQAEIRQTIDTVHKDVQILYDGVYVPSPPAPLALTSLTYHFGPAPAAPPPSMPPAVVLPGGLGAPQGSAVPPSAIDTGLAGGGQFAQTGFGGPQGAAPPTASVSTQPAPAPATANQLPATAGSVPGPSSSPAAPAGSSSSGAATVGSALPQAPSVSSPSSSVSAAPSLSSSASAAPSSAGSSSAPTSSAGAASSSPTSGAALVSSGGAGGSPSSAAAGSVAQPQGVAAAGGAAQGQPATSLPAAASNVAAPASLASTTASSASSAAFRPPMESTVSSSPVQGTSSASTPGSVSAGQSVPASAGPASSGGAAVGGGPSVAAPAAAAGVAAGAAAAAPLAPPPPAGVPNPAAPVLPASPGAVGTPGGSVGTPIAPPNVINTFGGHNVGAKLARMGSRTVGAGLSATPEFTAATALTGALNDPAFGVISEWACAVFQNPGEMPRFVIASREGLSWIPAGMFMPDGVIIAHLDDRIDWSVRKSWRGLRPPARVLSNYARVIGEEPRIVVARHYLGLDGLFSSRTVVVADDKTVIDPNPLRNPAGRHRLELASLEGWWPQIQSIPEAEIAERIRGVASWVADTHDQAFGVDPLRASAVEQIGRSGGNHLWNEVEQRMHYVRAEIMTAPVDAPEPLSEGWNDGLVAAEQMLRGWEALWFGQRSASRETLADMTYAAVAATM